MSPDHGIFLSSERLDFRPWRAEDADLAVALWADPDVARFIQSGPPSPEAARSRP